MILQTTQRLKHLVARRMQTPNSAFIVNTLMIAKTIDGCESLDTSRVRACNTSDLMRRTVGDEAVTTREALSAVWVIAGKWT